MTDLNSLAKPVAALLKQFQQSRIVFNEKQFRNSQ